MTEGWSPQGWRASQGTYTPPAEEATPEAVEWKYYFWKGATTVLHGAILAAHTAEVFATQAFAYAYDQQVANTPPINDDDEDDDYE